MSRRTIAGACLLAAPVLHAASYFLWPSGSEGTYAQQLTSARAHAGAWTAATWVETIGWLLLLPALVLVWHELRGRGRTLTAVGVWVSVLGVLGFFAAGVLNVVTIALARKADPAAALEALEALHGDSGLFLMAVAPLLLGLLGFVTLAAGLARAGWVGWWAPVASLVAVVTSEALSESDNPVLLTLTFAPLAAAWWAMARGVLHAPRTADGTSRRQWPSSLFARTAA
jgi:hypothetical protein